MQVDVRRPRGNTKRRWKDYVDEDVWEKELSEGGTKKRNEWKRKILTRTYGLNRKRKKENEK